MWLTIAPEDGTRVTSITYDVCDAAVAVFDVDGHIVTGQNQNAAAVIAALLLAGLAWVSEPLRANTRLSTGMVESAPDLQTRRVQSTIHVHKRADALYGK
jgi:hypothetical protein